MAGSPFSNPRYRQLALIGWLLCVAIHSWVLYSYGWPLKVALVDSFISNFLLALAGLGISTTLRFYIPSSNRYGYLLALTFALAFVWFLLCRAALLLLPYAQEEYQAFFSQSGALRFATGFLVLSSVTLIHVLWYTLQQNREDEQRKNEMESLAREAELYHLKEQLHPHFLFNSLNSINALVGSQPEAARSMIQQLADFLRGTLRSDHMQWRTLPEELQQLQLYLDIEKVRFGHRLQTEVHIAPQLEQARIPAMLLQPIVENAIKFGLYDTTAPITIAIDASLQQNKLVVSVSNPFDPQTVSRKKGTGFGLRSVERRLYLLFAQAGLLTTSTNENQFITTIHIPQNL